MRRQTSSEDYSRSRSARDRSDDRHINGRSVTHRERSRDRFNVSDSNQEQTRESEEKSSSKKKEKKEKKDKK